MPITLVGKLPSIERVQTGFWSLDRALQNGRGERGFPLRTIVELYGYEGVGKSTFCWDIASRLNPNGTVCVGALETLDPEYMQDIMRNAGFDGTIEIAKGDTDEEFVTHLATVIAREDVHVGILDSVGAISPIAEISGEMGEANMGRRAHITAQFSRRIQNVLRNKETPTVVFVIAHLSQIIGGRGSETTGGTAKKFLASLRIRLRRVEGFDDGSYLIEGKLEKNRWGIEDKTFQMCYLSGKGFHTGLSAVFDCVTMGLAKRERVIKMGDDSYGFISKLFAQASDGQDAVFEPFKDALKAFDKETK
jgi:RecA/RadA recombinase